MISSEGTAPPRVLDAMADQARWTARARHILSHPRLYSMVDIADPFVRGREKPSGAVSGCYEGSSERVSQQGHDKKGELPMDWKTSVDSTLSDSSRYRIIIPPETLERAADYLIRLRLGDVEAGSFVRRALRTRLNDPQITALDLLGALVDSKQPSIFAESDVAGDGSDWNLIELALLGDISIAASVTIFDSGDHDEPTPHSPPFPGTLIFTPGALLRNDRGCTPADWREVTDADGNFFTEGYYRLYKRRLLPVLQYINAHTAKPRSALVTVPGIGCGQFSGPFRGMLGPRLKVALRRLLREYGESLPNLRVVYFDPHSGSENERQEINGISFLARPLKASGNHGKTQLCFPTAYEDPGDDFSNCRLYSIVAWDHVSWPGNDFFDGARVTDDGVKAAATSSMQAITGVEGSYDAGRGMYVPPRPFKTWKDLVEDEVARNKLRLWNPLAVWSIEDPDFKNGRTGLMRAKPPDWKTEPLPIKRTVVALNRSFSRDEMERIQAGFVPEVMEHKWFIYWHDKRLFFHRSWSGYCVYIVSFARQGDTWTMISAEVNRDPQQYRSTDDEFDKDNISDLIDGFLLRRW